MPLLRNRLHHVGDEPLLAVKFAVRLELPGRRVELAHPRRGDAAVVGDAVFFPDLIRHLRHDGAADARLAHERPADFPGRGRPVRPLEPPCVVGRVLRLRKAFGGGRHRRAGRDGILGRARRVLDVEGNLVDAWLVGEVEVEAGFTRLAYRAKLVWDGAGLEDAPRPDILRRPVYAARRARPLATEDDRHPAVLLVLREDIARGLLGRPEVHGDRRRLQRRAEDVEGAVARIGDAYAGRPPREVEIDVVSPQAAVGLDAGVPPRDEVADRLEVESDRRAVERVGLSAARHRPDALQVRRHAVGVVERGFADGVHARAVARVARKPQREDALLRLPRVAALGVVEREDDMGLEIGLGEEAEVHFGPEALGRLAGRVGIPGHSGKARHLVADRDVAGVDGLRDCEGNAVDEAEPRLRAGGKLRVGEGLRAGVRREVEDGEAVMVVVQPLLGFGRERRALGEGIAHLLRRRVRRVVLLGGDGQTVGAVEHDPHAAGDRDEPDVAHVPRRVGESAADVEIGVVESAVSAPVGVKGRSAVRLRVGNRELACAADVHDGVGDHEEGAELLAGGLPDILEPGVGNADGQFRDLTRIPFDLEERPL